MSLLGPSLRRVARRVLQQHESGFLGAQQTFSAAAIPDPVGLQLAPVSPDPGPAPIRNNAGILYGINDMRFEQFNLPQVPAPGTVRVRVSTCGICGSDVHYWKRGKIADFHVNAPMVLGHESAGTIVELGEGVTDLAVGDRVAMEPGIPCWTNKSSREGRYNLSEDLKFWATPPYHGSLMEYPNHPGNYCRKGALDVEVLTGPLPALQYLDHPSDFCFKMPRNVTMEEGAMIEPLSVAVHACRRGEVQPGKNVVIMGAGPIGLLALKAVQAYGADNIAIADVKQENLDRAALYGANILFRPRMDDLPEESARRLKAIFPPHGPDIIIDAAGFEVTVQTSIRACAPGGRVVLVGMGQEYAKIPSATVAVKEISLLGSFRYANTYPMCIKMMENKRIDVGSLITHRYPFTGDGMEEAFDTAYRAVETKAIKVMINIAD